MDHGPVVLLPISDLAVYLRNQVPKQIPESLKLKERFNELASEGEIRNGVVAFRNFLYVFCDKFLSHGQDYFKPRKNPKNEIDYPMLYTVTDLLSDIGYYGKLAESGDAMLVTKLPSFTAYTDENGSRKQPKNSGVKLTQALRYLEICGFSFSGVDLKAKKVVLSEGQLVEVTYTENPMVFIGLKALSIADIEMRVKRYVSDYHRDNLLLCDYRLLIDPASQEVNPLDDFLQHLPEQVKTFALDLHKHHTENELVCESIVTTFRTNFAYSYMKKSRKPWTSKKIYDKRLWELASSTKHGYNLVIRAKKMDQYPELIEKLPVEIQKKIERGYGCDRKLFDQPCQMSCQGFRFSLDESILDVSEGIKLWLDKELSYKK